MAGVGMEGGPCLPCLEGEHEQPERCVPPETHVPLSHEPCVSPPAVGRGHSSGGELRVTGKVTLAWQGLAQAEAA